MGLPCRDEYNYYEEPCLTNVEDYSEDENSLSASQCKPKILVIAVGGGGGNALNYMIRNGMKGFNTIAMNTDASDISYSLCEKTLLLGEELTRGLGAGATSEVGRLAARASKEAIRRAIQGFDMVYIAACMGGGTGTGAAPVVAEVARDCGALTVAVVTRPFFFEGKKKARVADEGIARIRKNVDALIVIENDKIIASSQKNTRFSDAITLSDAILASAVGGVSDLVTNSGYINVDFADVKAVLKDSGEALMGVASACGSSSVLDATKQAIIEIVNSSKRKVASAAILNIVCKNKAGLAEIAQASNFVQEYLLEDAEFVLGHIDNVSDLDCDAKVTVILAGIVDSNEDF
ncbi:MAG: cell division protein FtsZ [Synergistaceae bacterium]|nr:cell division protein FtsZ [Synergistaceae bacterium]